MLEVRVLVAMVALLNRLEKHPPRTCVSDSSHGPVDPVLGTLDLSMPEVDAAVYRCSNNRCGWARFDKLKES